MKKNIEKNIESIEEVNEDIEETMEKPKIKKPRTAKQIESLKKEVKNQLE